MVRDKHFLHPNVFCFRQTFCIKWDHGVIYADIGHLVDNSATKTTILFNGTTTSILKSVLSGTYIWQQT